MIFLLAFAHSTHVQRVPINSPVGRSENRCAQFSYPPVRNEGLAIQNGQVKQMEVEFLCPLSCAKLDRIGICHSISLIYVYNPPQFVALLSSHYYYRNYPLLLGHGCSSKYVCCVCRFTVWLSSHPLSVPAGYLVSFSWVLSPVACPSCLVGQCHKS